MNYRRITSFSLVLLCLLVLVFFFPGAFAQGDAPDWQAFLSTLISTAADTLLNLVMTFGGGVIPAFVVGFVVDRLVKLVPLLSPFRELLKQWVLSRLEKLKGERAKGAALQAGQAMRDQLRLLSEQGEVTERNRALIEENLKEVRNLSAVEQLLRNRTAKSDAEAKALLRGAVAELKSQGVNP